MGNPTLDSNVSDQSAQIDTRVPFFHGITFKVLVGLLIFDTVLVTGIVTVMNTVGSDLVRKETGRLIEETGKGVVGSLTTRLEKVEALTRSLANAGESLAGDEQATRRLIENMVDFDQDTGIAGGGVWYEPGEMSTDVVRRSFFWGRDQNDQLQFFDDYNNEGPAYDEDRFQQDPAYRQAFLASPGYHNEEWYVVVRHLKESDRAFWSRSYMDPYSFQPMVTATAAMRDRQGRFIGVATVDLKLEGMHELVASWSERTGGYLFIADRTNKMITFPRPELAKRVTRDENQRPTVAFLYAQDIAREEPLFGPIAAALDQLENELHRQAQAGSVPSQLIKTIDASSYQIDKGDATLITSVLANPWGNDPKLVKRLDLNDDFLLGEAVVVSIFHVPHAYWRAVIVKPASEYVIVARHIKGTLLTYILAMVLLIFLLASAYQLILVVRPVKQITDKVAGIGRELQQGKTIEDIEDKNLELSTTSEIGRLAVVFNTLTHELVRAHAVSRGYSQDLERRVDERTRELEETQAIALENAHAAGMAEIATGILHNIGNVLNSMNTSVNELSTRYRGNHYQNYARAVSMIQDHLDDPRTFFDEEPERAAKLLRYFSEFGGFLNKTLDQNITTVTDMEREIHIIREIILTQHRYAKGRDFYEEIDLARICDDALALETRALEKSGIAVLRKYAVVEHIWGAKTKLMHILVNLIKNGREAMELSDGSEPILTIELGRDEYERPYICIADTGVGIDENDLISIFAHGFTTKARGNGFGLHYCANAAEEMGGKLSVQSDGLGKGASFLLVFPPKEIARAVTAEIEELIRPD